MCIVQTSHHPAPSAPLHWVSVWLIKSFTIKLSGKWVATQCMGAPAAPCLSTQLIHWWWHCSQCLLKCVQFLPSKFNRQAIISPPDGSQGILPLTHALTELTNCTLYNTLSIALTVHYCTLDVLMSTQTTFKSPVLAVTGSAGWCVRSRFASSAHEHGAMYKVANLKLDICLLCRGVNIVSLL